jgi:hypothetical protein
MEGEARSKWLRSALFSRISVRIATRSPNRRTSSASAQLKASSADFDAA